MMFGGFRGLHTLSPPATTIEIIRNNQSAGWLGGQSGRQHVGRLIVDCP
jgi:hypothetical protein